MEIEERVYSMFSSIAKTMGYSEVHAKTISILLIENKALSLQELSKRTGYSLASLSISLDLLELLGIIKKIKNSGDRRLYVKLDGDILEGLRGAMLIKLQRDIKAAINEFDKYKKDKKTKKIASSLEKEIRRLEEYINKLAAVEIPKK
jgi:DNA-binding transcriptional regulator GbsR (MarR family)